MKKLFRGRRKFATIPAIALIAFLFWPFFLSASFGYLAYKKVPNKKLKVGLVGFLILLDLGAAPHYYARFESAESAKPPVEASVQQAVMGEYSTPTLPPDPTATATPEPISIPTNTPIPTASRAPTKYIPPPTKAPTQYVAPTTAQQQSGGLSNDNYYTNTAGNEVHAPAYSNDGSVPAGATARCADGTYRFSQSRRRTCSGHGVVAQWL
jgi:hypothetical protein